MQLFGSPLAYRQESCYPNNSNFSGTDHVICTRRSQVSYINLTIKHTSFMEVISSRKAKVGAPTLTHLELIKNLYRQWNMSYDGMADRTPHSKWLSHVRPLQFVYRLLVLFTLEKECGWVDCAITSLFSYCIKTAGHKLKHVHQYDLLLY